MNDWPLLWEYVDRGSEAAFESLAGMGDRFKPILFVDQPDASDAPDGSDGAFSE